MAILILKLSSLGDVVQTLPAVSLLKKYLPDEKLHWVVEEPYAEILWQNPLIDQVITNKKGFLKSSSELLRLLRHLRRNVYRMVIDYQGLLKSGVIAGIARAEFKVGFANHREGSPFFYNHRFPPYDPETHAVLRYLKLSQEALRLLGKNIGFEYSDLSQIPRDVYLPVERFEGLANPCIVLLPETRWETKLWLRAYWEKLVGLLSERLSGFSFYLAGQGMLRPWADDLERRYNRVISLVGRVNLKQLVYLLRRAELVVTVDTGPMHIASALDRPIVALFGPTAPQRTGPWSTRFKVVKANLACSPCFKKSCQEKLCMKNLKPENVLSAIGELMGFDFN